VEAALSEVDRAETSGPLFGASDLFAKDRLVRRRTAQLSEMRKLFS
jgi:hypothetical protein